MCVFVYIYIYFVCVCVCLCVCVCGGGGGGGACIYGLNSEVCRNACNLTAAFVHCLYSAVSLTCVRE